MTQPFNLLFLVLTIGLIARLTRFLVDDTLTQNMRHKVFTLSQPGGDFVTEQANPQTGAPRVQAWHERPTKLKHKLYSFLHKILDCAWCCSVWVAAEVVSVAAYCVNAGGAALTAYWWVAAAGTASLATGVLTTWLYSKDA